MQNNQEMFREDGLAEPCEAPKDARKLVLLIGDSICIGYREKVKQALADRYEVVYPEENCRATPMVITSLYSWSKKWPGDRVAAVQFNCGHWDVAHWNGEPESLTPLDQYAKNIGRIVRQLKKFYPQAKIAFATSTPMNPNGVVGVNPRTTDEIIRYNEAAVVAAKENGAVIHDLFSVAASWGPEQYQDYGHFIPAGFEIMGSVVADHLQALLENASDNTEE